MNTQASGAAPDASAAPSSEAKKDETPPTETKPATSEASAAPGAATTQEQSSMAAKTGNGSKGVSADLARKMQVIGDGAKAVAAKGAAAKAAAEKEKAAKKAAAKKPAVPKKPAAKKPADKKPATPRKSVRKGESGVEVSYPSTQKKCPYREGTMKAKAYAAFAAGGTRQHIIAAMEKLGATANTASTWLQSFRRYVAGDGK